MEDIKKTLEYIGYIERGLSGICAKQLKLGAMINGNMGHNCMVG